jgi:hypothetical protein
MSAAEIIKELPRLTDAERRAVIQKLRELDAEAWDRQIEIDAESGALDRMYEKLTGGDPMKDARPLDDLLNDSKLS